jgi:hypothetical protein
LSGLPSGFTSDSVSLIGLPLALLGKLSVARYLGGYLLGLASHLSVNLPIIFSLHSSVIGCEACVPGRFDGLLGLDPNRLVAPYSLIPNNFLASFFMTGRTGTLWQVSKFFAGGL